MAARELMEDESVLSLEKIKSLFNQFCRDTAKLVTAKSIEPWILHRTSRQRLFGITATSYRRLPAAQRAAAREDAVTHFSERLDAVFQRRHDCIHNCDRPKVALQPITDAALAKAIEDIEFLVTRSSVTLCDEFSAYLSGLGFNGHTRNQVCM